MSNFPKKMLAAILVKQKSQLLIDEISLPTKLSVGQVLVKIFYTSICGSQLGEIDGNKGSDPYIPHLLGHEASGKVIAIGTGVKTVHPGNHVVLHWMPGIGIQADPPVYSWKNEPLNAGLVTTFNEYAIVSENRLTNIPKDFDLTLATLFGCAVTTGLGIVNNSANIKIGESVVVFGAGGVGLNTIQGAAMVSADPIIAVDLYYHKLDFARQFGATHVVNSIKENPINTISDILPKGADIIIENTGNFKVIEAAYSLVSSTGKVILVGVPEVNSKISIYTLPLHFGKKIVGTKGGECLPHIDIPRYIHLFNNGKLELKKLITDQFSLLDINVAIDKMRKGNIKGRCLIRMDHE